MSALKSEGRRSELAAELDSLAEHTANSIRSKRGREMWARSLDLACWLLLVVPALWILGLATGALANAPRALVIPLTIAVPFGALLWRWAGAHYREVDDRDALAVLDQELGLEDRLLTAREFLDSNESSPFTEAAIEDAAAIVARVRAAKPRLERVRWEPSRQTFGAVALALTLLLMALLLEFPGSTGSERAPGNIEPSTLVAELLTEEVDESSELRTEAENETTPEPEPPATPQATTPSKAERRDQAGELSDNTKESAGKTGEGRSSDAEASSSASESRGQPSNQSQMSKAAEKKLQAAPKKKKPRAPSDVTPTPRKTEEDDSGSTAGRGSSKGSSKNPAASKWSSKDQVTNQDDQEIEDDEETEDEEEDQESRGGVQPNLRSRKPPVSRDLRIGFGNQKNPDANGRGGPSEAKKSRGTASLVLGVPIPDRVKGQPSAGKTKITQERIEPKPEDEPAIGASSRAARSESTGYIEERELTPWMRTLVREYFLALRETKKQP